MKNIGKTKVEEGETIDPGGQTPSIPPIGRLPNYCRSIPIEWKWKKENDNVFF